MRRCTDWRRALRSVLGPILLLLCVVGMYATVIFGYSAFEYESEWKAEQEDFESLAADVDYERQRLLTSSASAQIYGSKYSLGSSDVYGIIAGFLNKTLLTVPNYKFKWAESPIINRMYDHALQLNDDASLKFNKPSTKIINIVFRSILPIFTTFAVGSSVSALHSIATSLLQICIRQKKYEAWTVGRNKMLRINASASLILAVVYFVLCFILAVIASSRWQNVSFGEGVKITLNLIATIPPNVQRKSSIDAHTLAAICFLIHSATAYVIFAVIQFIKTWRISEFAIPLISDIDKADKVDRDVQHQYRAKREELFQIGKKADGEKVD